MRRKGVAFGLLFLISTCSLVWADEDDPQSPFTNEDCECTGLNMSLHRTQISQDRLECWYKAGEQTWIQPAYINIFPTAKAAQDAFNESTDPERTWGGVTIGQKREEIKKNIEEGYPYEDYYTIFEDEFTSNRASLVWSTNWNYQGWRIFIYKERYIIGMRGERFDSETEILDAMNTLEQCLRSVVDEKETGKVSQEEATFSQTLTISDHPLPYLTITLTSNGKTYETTTDDQGFFSVTSEQSEDHHYDLLISFSHLRDDICYYQLHFHWDPTPISIKLSLQDDMIQSASFFFGHTIGTLTHDGPFGSLSNFSLDDLINVQGEVLDYATMYLHFSEVVSFYVDHLGESLDFQLPVYVYTCIEGAPRYRHTEGKSWISIDGKRTRYQTEYRPKSREYHEFSHYAMHALYGGIFPQTPASLGTEVNHGGYNNPTTADSYVEGFAEFMSVVIGEYYGNYWENLTEKRGGGASSCPPFGSLEQGFNAWELEGKAEEWAVAGVLWDLYDGSEQIQKDNEFLERAYQHVSEEIIFHRYDVNHDDIFQREEQIIHFIIMTYDTGGIEDALYLTPNEITTLISDIIVSVREQGQDPLSVKQKETYKKQVAFDTYDTNGDGEVNNEEWTRFVEDQFNFTDSVYEPEDILMSAYSYDLSMNETELIRLLAGEEVRRDWMNTYDTNGDEDLTIEEMIPMAVMFEEAIRSFSDEASSLLDTILIPPELKKIQNILNETDLEDDDAVNLSFEEMWPILKSYHNDFTSVYESFIKAFPDQKEGIKDIFKSHGFFADINPENRQWDEGEEIGRAANASTLQRQQRRSSEPFPGFFIKVDNDIPFYRVQILILDDPLLLQTPVAAYTVFCRNDDGMIYVPVPPKRYHARILIEAEGVETINPLCFSSSQVYSAYDQAVEQGYLLEYSFETEGEIPVLKEGIYVDVEDTVAADAESAYYLSLIHI